MPPLCNTRRRPSFELGFAPPICATCTIAPVSQAYTSDRIIARAATKFASSFTSHFTSLHFAWLQLCEPEEFISNSQMHQKADIRITLTWPQSLFVHKNKESQRSMTREETTDAWTFTPTLDHFPMGDIMDHGPLRCIGCTIRVPQACPLSLGALLCYLVGVSEAYNRRATSGWPFSKVRLKI